MAISKIINDGIGDIDELTVDTNTLYVDATNNRVGIGTSSPSEKLQVQGSGTTRITVGNSTVNTTGQTTGIDFEPISNLTNGAKINVVNGLSPTTPSAYTAGFQFVTEDYNGSSFSQKTAVTIGASGNVLVGKTSTSGNVAGMAWINNEYLQLVNTETGSGDRALLINRQSADGTLVEFRKANSTVGSIGTQGGRLTIGDGDTGLRFADDFNNIQPFNVSTNGLRDNAIDLGSGAGRFDDIFATNGTIQTSDQNEKQQIASLTDAEITAAKAISKLFKTFKWNDKVEAKGDNARTHTGVIAQDVQQAMTDAGLDAGDYAFFISTTWWEAQTEVPAVEADEENGIEAVDAYTRTDTYDTAEEAPEGATERTRLGIRYPELLAFVGAATEQRLADIETRLTALEAN